MRIIALDPANLCGYAWSDGHARAYGAWRLNLADDRAPGDRLARFYDRLNSLIALRGCDQIVYEDAMRGSKRWETCAAHSELRAIIRLVAQQHGTPCRAVHPARLKLWATGHGNAKKPEMIRACATHLGVVTTDDNVADALLLLELATKDPGAMDPTPGKKPKRRRVKAKQAKLFC